MAEQDEREAYELRQREKGEAERQREEEAFDQMAYEGDLIRRAEAAESRLAALRERLAALVEEWLKHATGCHRAADVRSDPYDEHAHARRVEGIATRKCADRLAALLSANGEGQPRPSGKK